MAPTSSKISPFPGSPEPRPLVIPVDLTVLLRDSDPTREIRRYIEQLQDAVREACSRTTLVEEDRERFSAEVSRLRADLETLRGESRETRRDRDTLSEQTAQYGAMLADLKQKAESSERQRVDVTRQRDEAIKFYKDSQRQIEETMRVKDEAIKQRDAFARQRDVAKKEREDLALRLAQVEAQLLDFRKTANDSNREEFQKQITALRQARDAAATQCAELKHRMSQLEDEIANLAYEREVALQAAAKTTEEINALRADLEHSASDAHAKSDAVKDEAEELKKKIIALKRRNTTLSEAVDKLTTEAQMFKAAQEQTAEGKEGEVLEIRRELEKLAHEREAEMEEYGTKLDELRAAHQNELQIARQQYETAMNDRDQARVAVQERESEMETLRSQIMETRSILDSLSTDAFERTQQIETLQLEKARAEQVSQALLEAQSALAETQQQVEQLVQEREHVREQMGAQITALEERLANQADDFTRLKQLLGEAGDKAVAHEALVREHEEHRLQIIELSAKLATAHAEIKELSAQLAEARLRIMSATRSAKDAEINNAGEPIDPTLNKRLNALRRTFQDYLRQPSDFNLLNDLQNHAQLLGDRARETGQMVVQRVSSVLAALTRELYEMPDQATSPTMRSVGQSVEFIGTLLKQSNLDEKVNLAQLRAFAVDDDQSVLDAVGEALSAAGVDAITTDSAGAALAELACAPYDLVILDVNLPELDGLELCSHLREMEMHATTPVIFITGHASPENRVQFSMRGGTELLIKPFNLLDLALRSLSLIIREKLKKA